MCVHKLMSVLCVHSIPQVHDVQHIIVHLLILVYILLTI